MMKALDRSNMMEALNTAQVKKRGVKTAARKSKARAVRGEPEGINSLGRLLGVLDLFTPAAPAWSADELIRSLGKSRSTGYRYVKALTDVGLLTPVSNGYYILGPRIVELDRQIRQCDPLYNAAGTSMKQLVAASGHSALLCALFSGSVLCVREELTPDSPANLFTRGQRRPLFQGAASKIILPYLRPHQLRSLFAKHAKTIATSGLGSDWESFRANLAKIRRDGVMTTVGEFNPGVVGISAPIFNRSGQILGSIGVAGNESKLKRGELDRIATLVKKAAEQVNERISVFSLGTDRPARAVG
jgi:DNA-binding IclR family transcriptional regulator